MPKSAPSRTKRRAKGGRPGGVTSRPKVRVGPRGGWTRAALSESSLQGSQTLADALLQRRGAPIGRSRYLGSSERRCIDLRVLRARFGLHRSRRAKRLAARKAERAESLDLEPP